MFFESLNLTQCTLPTVNTLLVVSWPGSLGVLVAYGRAGNTVIRLWGKRASAVAKKNQRRERQTDHQETTEDNHIQYLSRLSR